MSSNFHDDNRSTGPKPDPNRVPVMELLGPPKDTSPMTAQQSMGLVDEWPES